MFICFHIIHINNTTSATSSIYFKLKVNSTGNMPVFNWTEGLGSYLFMLVAQHSISYVTRVFQDSF